jgi:hypothetical protein
MTPSRIRTLRNAVFATLASPLIAHAMIIPAVDINELVKRLVRVGVRQNALAAPPRGQAPVVPPER